MPPFLLYSQLHERHKFVQNISMGVHMVKLQLNIKNGILNLKYLYSLNII